MREELRTKAITWLVLLAFVGSVLSVPKLSIKVEAAGAYVKSLSVRKKVTIKQGERIAVKPTVTRVKKAIKTVTVKSGNKKIAKASYFKKKNMITITGLKAGNTHVTVTTKGKNRRGKKLSKRIRVTVHKADSLDNNQQKKPLENPAGIPSIDHMATEKTPTGQPTTEETPTEHPSDELPSTERPTNYIKKNANDVAALSALIQRLRMEGASVSANINNAQYVWEQRENEKEARLVEINWRDETLAETISFADLKALRVIICSGPPSIEWGRIRQLDVSQNTELVELECNRNKLTSLDVSKNTALTSLACFGNYLTELDVSRNVNLKLLSCRKNYLTSLNVCNNKVLEELWCGPNMLRELDLSQNVLLRELECGNNYLTELDVSRQPALEYLYCMDNQLSCLDVSKNTALTYLNCQCNLLTTLDVSNNPLLKDLEVDDDVTIIRK